MLISLAAVSHGFSNNNNNISTNTEGSAAAAAAHPHNFLGHILAGHDNSAVPALLYTLAAASQSLGAHNLDILPYLMLSQVKLILTPVFSRAFLKQTLQPHQWLCLAVLTAGMTLVQVGSAARSSSGAPPRASGGDAGRGHGLWDRRDAGRGVLQRLCRRVHGGRPQDVGQQLQGAQRPAGGVYVPVLARRADVAVGPGSEGQPPRLYRPGLGLGLAASRWRVSGVVGGPHSEHHCQKLCPELGFPGGLDNPTSLVASYIKH